MECEGHLSLKIENICTKHDLNKLILRYLDEIMASLNAE